MMNTILDAFDSEKISPTCREALQAASADTLIHALLRPARQASGPSIAPLSPEPIDDAIRSAGDALGQGPQLLKDLQADLELRTESLRPWLSNYTYLWLADALSVHLPAMELAKLSHRSDVRLIDLQPRVSPARRGEQDIDTVVGRPAPGLHLDLASVPKPKIGLVDVSPSGVHDPTFAEATFDTSGRPRPVLDAADPSAHADLLGETWYNALQDLIPDAHWLRASVFDPGQSGTFAQIIAGMQWTLERDADLVILDLGEAALDPIWHLPMLNCTLAGTSVVVAGMERNDKDRPLWPVHLPLAGCYNRGPLRTDLWVSGAPLGPNRLQGSLAAAARAAAAIILLQTVAPRLKYDPAALVGPLFAGPNRGLAPGGELELDPESMLKAISSAA